MMGGDGHVNNRPIHRLMQGVRDGWKLFARSD